MIRIPKRIAVLPHPQTGAAVIELVLADDSAVPAVLSAEQAKAIVERLTAILDGSIFKKAPSRRGLVIDLRPKAVKS
jgi:hypothetical protein